MTQPLQYIGAGDHLDNRRGIKFIGLMKVRIKLFGTLCQLFPGYDMERGMEVEIPDGATVKDLYGHLGIPETRGGVAAVDGVILQPEDPLKEGASIHLLQTVHGG